MRGTGVERTCERHSFSNSRRFGHLCRLRIRAMTRSLDSETQFFVYDFRFFMCLKVTIIVSPQTLQSESDMGTCLRRHLATMVRESERADEYRISDPRKAPSCAISR